MKSRIKILVTGGMGYIGTHTIVSLWENGFEPIIVDNFSNARFLMIKQLNLLTNKTNKIYPVDCLNRESLKEVFIKEKNIKGIIHFAAFKSVEDSIYNPQKYYENNTQSLFNILQIAKKFKVENFVFSSSCTVYGNTNFIPVNENQLLQKPTSPYGHTKQLGEVMVERFSNYLDSFNSLSLRYFNPVGAHPSGLIGELPISTPKNLFPVLTQKAIKNELFVINGSNYDTHDGTCVRDFIHVMDLALAHVKSLQYLFNKPEKKSYSIFNIGTGKGTSILDIVTIFKETIKPSFSFTIKDGRPGDIPKIYACTKKAEKLLQWKASKSIRNALIDQWNWEIKSRQLFDKLKKVA